MQLFKKTLELVVIRNAIQPTPSDIELYCGDDLQALLRQAFATPNLPRCVRLYHNSLHNEVTPQDKQGVDKLLSLDGRIYAVVVPMGLDPVSWLIIGISVLVSVAVALLLPMPQIPNTGTQAPSPNNALAQRSNRQRLGGRVTDIVGEAWSVPDLIAPTYSVYINGEEVEYSYMCIGRGSYAIKKAYDDTTPVEQIRGACVQVYAPNISVNADPQVKFGGSYTEQEQALSRMYAKRYTSVNGQALPPTDNLIAISFTAKNGGIITANDFDFSQYKAGDTVTISKADKLESGNHVTNADGSAVTYNLNGTYTVASSTASEIVLQNPETANADWGKLNSNTDFTVAKEFDLGAVLGSNWVGYFYTDDSDFTHILINLVAPQGIYNMAKDGERWAGLDITFEIEFDVLDQNDRVVASGSSNAVIYSRGGEKYANENAVYPFTTDDNLRRSTALSFFLPTDHEPGHRVRWRIRRKTPLVKFSGQTIVQDVKLKDFYTVRHIKDSDTPQGVTTVYVKQLATEGAMSLKERKLRLLVERYVKNWRDNDNLILSKQADDIIYHLATDSLVGNLTREHIDIEQITAEMDVQRAYFGHNKCGEFCYSFDDINLSSEETLQTVAQAVFGQLYRFDNKLRLYFERPQPVGVAIFNSHNMLPDSYSRSESFGVTKDFDGVTVKYTDPKDDAQVSVYYPAETAVNPDNKTIVGVRNETQAKCHMMRIWYKHLYSHKSIEFVGADESNIVMRSQRIDVADQLRVGVLQGVVMDLQTVGSDIVMTLSNPVQDFATGTLFIQLINGQVDSMSVSKLSDFTVKLPRMPMHTISTDIANVVQCAYQLVRDNETPRNAFIVTEKTPDNSFNNKITAINYDDRYYSGDIKEIIKVQNV